MGSEKFIHITKMEPIGCSVFTMSTRAVSITVKTKQNPLVQPILSFVIIISTTQHPIGFVCLGERVCGV